MREPKSVADARKRVNAERMVLIGISVATNLELGAAYTSA
jgi:hypothetical protein